MFMDLASEFGEAGFEWVFVISHHGAQRSIQRNLDPAAIEYRETRCRYLRERNSQKCTGRHPCMLERVVPPIFNPLGFAEYYVGLGVMAISPKLPFSNS